MKITVQDEEFFYIYDSCKGITHDEDYCVESIPVGLAVDSALELLACVYTRKKVAAYVANGSLPILDYLEEEKDKDD